MRRFEWDGSKDRLNRRKHGVGFGVASRVFADPNMLLVEDRVDEGGEQRWHAIGLVGGAVLLVVAHVYREGRYGEEVIRIISARQANQRERRVYSE